MPLAAVTSSGTQFLWQSPEILESKIVHVLARSTARAALASAHARGRNNRHFADLLAVEAMREVLDRELLVGAEVVIGEGERDEAPMLYIGERLGPNKDQPPLLLIAVDPLEGTNLAAHWMPGAICVIAATLVGEGKLWGGVDGYMEKFIAGPKIAEGLAKLSTMHDPVSEMAKRFGKGRFVLDQEVEAIADMAAYFTQKPLESLVVEALDRPRNEDFINRLRRKHVQVRLITDGDVTSAHRALSSNPDVDFYMGIGAAPEGVISAAMANVLRGYAEGRCWFDGTAKGEDQRSRLLAKGLDVNRVHTLEDLAGGHVMVAFTAVTDTGSKLPGVSYRAGGTAISHTFSGRSRTGTNNITISEHHAPPPPPVNWPAAV